MTNLCTKKKKKENNTDLLIVQMCYSSRRYIIIKSDICDNFEAKPFRAIILSR